MNEQGSKVGAIWAHLKHGPQTVPQLVEALGIDRKKLMVYLRGMVRRGSAILDNGTYSAGTEPKVKKTWASTAERMRHYSSQYQRRIMAENGEKAAEYRANRRKREKRLRDARPPTEAQRLAGLKRAQQIVRQMKAKEEKQRLHSAAAQDKREQTRANKAKITSAMSSHGPAANDCETVEQWMARTGQRPEVLQPGTWSAPLRFTY
jgi:hypothetical protein